MNATASTSRRWWTPVLLVALAIAGCTPDPGADTGSDLPTSAPTSDTRSEAARIAEECPPDDTDVVVPETWPGPPLVAVPGEDALRLDLADAIDAPCLVIATTFSTAMDIAIPDLGTVSVVEATTIDYVTTPEPADPDFPEDPWWGQDRIRACVDEGGGRLACTNIDVTVLRSEVRRLAELFDTDTLPQLLTPFNRDGLAEIGASPSAIANLQDAYAGAWARQLLVAAIAGDSPPATLVASCEALGRDSAEVWELAGEILEIRAPEIDVTANELAINRGQPPQEGLSGDSNNLMAVVTNWITCDIL